MSDAPNFPAEKAFYDASEDFLGRFLLGRYEDEPSPDISGVEWKEWISSRLFDIIQSSRILREERAKLTSLVDQLPEDVRVGADVLEHILPGIIIGVGLVRAGVRESIDPITCPDARSIEEFSAALVLASRATGLGTPGLFNNIVVPVTPDSNPVDIQNHYYTALFSVS